MATGLSSKFTALLAQDKHRLDRELGRNLRQARANLVLQGYSSTADVNLQKHQYETDIEERLATLLAILSRLLAGASVREIDDSKPELEQLAHAWLRVHIDYCQAQLNELAARNGLVSPDQIDLGRDRLLNALEVELALRSNMAPSVVATSEAFVDPVRIEELSSIPRSKFDVSRLVRLCEELNLCFRFGCFHAVAFTTRAILDHVPPVFGFKVFAEVANNYNGGKSFKKVASQLESVSREVCNALLHMPMRDSESLPTLTQVDVHQQVDTILAEVIRIGRRPA